MKMMLVPVVPVQVHVVLVALWMATAVAAYNVTTASPDNFTQVTQGKSVFVRFFAPWVGAVVTMVSSSLLPCHSHGLILDNIILSYSILSFSAGTAAKW
jgi:hypothetical protein